MRTGESRVRQRGVVIALFAMVMVVILLVACLSLDLGIAHVTMGRLSKAVDAGALSGARHAAAGTTSVTQIVQRVAAANYGSGVKAGVTATYNVKVETPAADTYRVTVTGTTKSPTFFTRLMDRKDIDVVALAEASRYPLDLTLVLDLSGSLERSGAFDDMQLASKNFIDSFEDSIDQVGIVTFSTWAWDLMTIRKNFKTVGKSLIAALVAISDTDTEEGLRLAKRQLDTAPKRDNATKIVVLFTDGRPTAFADALRLDGSSTACSSAPDPLAFNKTLTDTDKDGKPECWGGVVATPISGSTIRGIFAADTGKRVSGFTNIVPTLTLNSSSGTPIPLILPGGKSVTGDNIRAIGVTQSEDWANQIRAAGFTIYVVGLGDPDAANAGDVPDLDFLKRIANEDGVVNPAQTTGEMMFAPSAAELDATFARLADRILTRLTR